jgi:hypothetical protein
MLHLQKYCYKWPDNGFKAIVAYQGETGYKYAKNTSQSDYFRYEITGN